MGENLKISIYKNCTIKLSFSREEYFELVNKMETGNIIGLCIRIDYISPSIDHFLKELKNIACSTTNINSKNKRISTVMFKLNR